MTNTPTYLLTIPQVAEQVGVHEKTVWKWLHDKKLAAVRFGARCTRIKQADLEALIARNTGLPANLNLQPQKN